MTGPANPSDSNFYSVPLEEALLSVPYPIVKFDGLELRVSYANDALLQLWSKDKSIIGKTFTEILPEFEDQPFPALLRRVLQTGETHTDSDALAYIEKNGVLQAIYFDYSYTAVRNSKGENTAVIVICKDVTEAVLAKQMLHESEGRFRGMALQAPFAISVLKGPEFIIETANSRCLDIWGKTSDVVGKKVVDAFPELAGQGFFDLLENVYQTAQPFYGSELPVQLVKHGTLTLSYLNFVYHPIVENGLVTSIMTVGYDVTDLVLSKKNAERKKELLEYLNKAGEELALTLDTETALKKIADLIVPGFADWFTINVLNGENLEILLIVNEDQEYVKWGKEYRQKHPVTIHDNEPQAHILRTGESMLVSRVSDEMLKAAIKDEEHLAVLKKMNLRSSIVVPMKVGNKITGTINFISTSEQREYNETDLNFAKDFGTRIALALENARLHEEAQQEIIERKKVEAALRESEIQFRSLSNAIPQLAWMADKDGWIFWYNERWFEYTGTTLDEMQGWGWEKVHHPDHKQNIIEFVKVAWKKGEPFELTFPLRRKDGEWRWFLTQVVPIFDAEGQLSRWFGTNTDITEQKGAMEQNQQLLREMEFERNRFEAVVKQMPGAVVIGEAPSGKLIFANDKIDEVWGRPLIESENVSEYTDWVGYHPDGRAYEANEWPLARSIQHGEVVNNEDVDIIRGDGRPAILRLSSAPIKDKTGKIIAGVVISQDVTILKQAIRSRDEFLSIASHELKTPLTTLSASIQILMRAYEKDTRAKSIPPLIEACAKSSTKLGNLISELLNVSKIESGQLKLNKSRFILADLINECCDHVKLQGTHVLDLIGAIDLEIFADKQRLDQVIVNFVDNAVKYAPDSPNVRIQIDKSGDNVKLSVTDHGIGIEKEKLPHLFDRYYRVDPTGMQYSGLGLGLYISSEIIKLHGGQVGVESTVNVGSTFWFTLPING